MPYVGSPPGLQPQQYAQTFTINNTGIFAAADFIVQLKGPISAPLTVDLFQGLPATNGSAIVAAPLASLTLPLSTNNEVMADFSAFNVPVTAGEVLALVFLSKDTSGNLRIQAENNGGIGGLYMRLPLDNQAPLRTHIGTTIMHGLQRSIP